VKDAVPLEQVAAYIHTLMKETQPIDLNS